MLSNSERLTARLAKSRPKKCVKTEGYDQYPRYTLPGTRRMPGAWNKPACEVCGEVIRSRNHSAWTRHRIIHLACKAAEDKAAMEKALAERRMEKLTRLAARRVRKNQTACRRYYARTHGAKKAD